MKKIILIIIILPNIAYAQYFEPFSKQDIILQSIYTAFTVIDWMQTKDFVSKGFKEMNPALGPEPSQQRIDTLIPLGIVFQAWTTYAMPIKYRQMWQTSFIGIQLYTFCNNYNFGHSKIIVNLKPVCTQYTVKIAVKF